MYLKTTRGQGNNAQPNFVIKIPLWDTEMSFTREPQKTRKKLPGNNLRSTGKKNTS